MLYVFNLYNLFVRKTFIILLSALMTKCIHQPILGFTNGYSVILKTRRPIPYLVWCATISSESLCGLQQRIVLLQIFFNTCLQKKAGSLFICLFPVLKITMRRKP